MIGLALATAMAGLLLTVIAPGAAHADVSAVRGYACDYYVNVGLFGGAQTRKGCGSGVPTTDVGYSPEVSLPSSGSGPITATDPDGAQAIYGPAVIHGGVWPEDLAAAPPSGPQFASTQGSTGAGGFVTSSADITLNPQPYPTATCASGFSPPCTVPGGFGPPPVWGDSLHVECTADETGVTGSTTFSNAFVAKATDANGSPLPSATEAVPDNPPANYTRSGVISNVGDVFTVVFNQQIINTDGSLTVNAVHMYLFGPTAVGEVVRGQVTCGTTPTPQAATDTVAPTCGTPVVEPNSPTDPTPKSPLTVLLGVFDAGKGTAGTGLASITNIMVNGAANGVNGTVTLGTPSSTQAYLQFQPGQIGPLPITANRSSAGESSNGPLTFSFDATDESGNVTHCNVPTVQPATVDVGNATPNPTPVGAGGTTHTVTFPVTLSAAEISPVTVSYYTWYGTATAGTDYVYQAGTITFAPGETSKSVVVTIMGDDTPEEDETFAVYLYNPQLPQAVSLRNQLGWETIQNNSAALPVLNIGNVSVLESQGPANFNVTLSAASTSTVTVQYSTMTYGTAASGTDYTPESGTLTFSPGTTSQTISVPIIDHTYWKPDQTFWVQLYNQTGANMGNPWGMGTIQNDVTPPVVSIADATPTAEGNSGTKPFNFTVTLSAPAGPFGASVFYATMPNLGTATSGTDYFAVSGTKLTFASGSTTATATVNVRGDTTPEPDETFYVQLYNPVGATLGNRFGTGTILNDDAGTVPVVSVGDGTPNPAPDGPPGAHNTITFPVTLTTTSTAAVTVSYATMPGYNGSTATSNVDYVYAESTLTIPAGQTSGNIVITLIGDSAPEPVENFYVQIYNPVNATLNANARYGQGFIANDD